MIIHYQVSLLWSANLNTCPIWKDSLLNLLGFHSSKLRSFEASSTYDDSKLSSGAWSRMADRLRTETSRSWETMPDIIAIRQIHYSLVRKILCVGIKNWTNMFIAVKDYFRNLKTIFSQKRFLWNNGGMHKFIFWKNFEWTLPIAHCLHQYYPIIENCH